MGVCVGIVINLFQCFFRYICLWISPGRSVGRGLTFGWRRARDTDGVILETLCRGVRDTNWAHTCCFCLHHQDRWWRSSMLSLLVEYPWTCVVNRVESNTLLTTEVQGHLWIPPQGKPGFFSDILPSERYLRAIRSVTLSYRFSWFSILSYALFSILSFLSAFQPNHMYFFFNLTPPFLHNIGFVASTYGSCTLELGGVF